MSQLYSTLNSNIDDSLLKASQKAEILKAMKNFNQDSLDAFFLLIYEHSKTTNINSEVSDGALPYGCKILENGLEFDMDVFPNKLLRILYKFTKIVDVKN